ncbi:sodium:alanine symporter family protein [Ectothiorhodospiraceae bacterium BW-2]|nr:sodium:alanine symporter family protein [Ectothiorhodospiraceae bacterium BW-2]
MELLASWLWQPLLSFIYLELGVLFLLVTGFAAWRYMGLAFSDLLHLRRHESQLPASDNPHQRHISQSKGFMAALAATVGVGNWAGVSTAIHLGGPGALFWIWVSALVGMSMRMCSVWLTMYYQPKDPDSPLFATPMSYLEKFSGGRTWLPLTFAVLLLVQGLFSAFIQSNSVAHAIENEVGESHLVVSLLLATLVGIVILGGVQKIVAVTTQIVPLMVAIYLLAGLYILLSDPLLTLNTLGEVFTYAFTPYAVGGGVAGYSVLVAIQFGVARGVFSHSSGLGLAPFLQASHQEQRHRSALLAGQVPVIDTLIICSVTGLVVLSYGDWQALNGAFLTVESFAVTFGSEGRLVLITLLLFFAYTTLVTWAYFAERSLHYLRIERDTEFRWLFILCVAIGPWFPVTFIWSLGDLIIGVALLLNMIPLFWLTLQHQQQMRRELTVRFGR